MKNKRGDFLDELQKSILASIKRLIDKKLNKLKFDYTVKGKVKEVLTEDEEYKVEINGENYDIKARPDLDLSEDDIVYVRVIQNNFSNKFIDCKKP